MEIKITRHPLLGEIKTISYKGIDQTEQEETIQDLENLEQEQETLKRKKSKKDEPTS